MITLFRSDRLRRLSLFPLVALVLGFLLAATMDRPWRQNLSLRSADLLGQVFSTTIADSRIVIVGIDNATLSDTIGYGRLTEWDRTLYATLLDRLNNAGARVVALDLLFNGQNPSGDSVFAAALERYPATVLAIAYNDAAQSIEFPTAQLRRAAPYLGHVVVALDQDGVLRRVPLWLGSTPERYPALGVQAAQRFWRLPADAEPSQASRRARLPNGLDLPLDDQANLLVNFAVQGDRYPIYLFQDVIANTVPAEHFRDKIVFVGSVAPAAGDLHFTPAPNRMYGVEVHANLTATLLQQAMLREQSPASQRAVIMVLALTLSLIAVAGRPIWLLIAFGAGLIAITLVGGMILAIANLRVDLAGPMITLTVVTLALLALQNSLQRREHAQVLALFAHQTSPSVLRELLRAADRGELRLGGERRTVTVVFADIRNYTTIAERLPPEDVMRLINTYLGIVARVLIAHGGTINQYAGDQAMAIFNAPLLQPDHAARGMAAAYAILEAVAAFNASPEAALLPAQVVFGAGVNTGIGVVGNVGAAERYDYTVIGDVTNLAARLCGLAPGATVYIGPDTLEEDIGPLRAHLTQVGLTPIKGKREPIMIHQLALATSQEAT